MFRAGYTVEHHGFTPDSRSANHFCTNICGTRLVFRAASVHQWIGSSTELSGAPVKPGTTMYSTLEPFQSARSTQATEENLPTSLSLLPRSKRGRFLIELGWPRISFCSMDGHRKRKEIAFFSHKIACFYFGLSDAVHFQTSAILRLQTKTPVYWQVTSLISKSVPWLIS